MATTDRTTTGLHRLLPTSTAAFAAHFCLQLVLGAALSTQYLGSVQGAHTSVAAMHSGPANALQAIHYWGSSILILQGLIQLILVVVSESYRSPTLRLYYGSLALFACALGFQLTGNLLPLDRHAVGTALVESSIATRAPIVGASLSRIALGGNGFSQNTLSFWYLLHKLLLVGLAIVGLWLVSANKFKVGEQRPNGRVVVGPFLIAVLLAIFVGAPFGDEATSADFASGSSLVSWYMWPLHGLMKLADQLIPNGGWIGAMGIPGLLALLLLAAPLLMRFFNSRVIRISCLVLLASIVGVGAAFGGPFAPLIGTRNPPVAAIQDSTSVTPIDSALAARGRTAFNKGACSGCHGQDGKVASGGPVLTNVWRQHGSADYFIRYIKNPSSMRAGSTMPAFPDLPSGDAAAMAEFLRSPQK